MRLASPNALIFDHSEGVAGLRIKNKNGCCAMGITNPFDSVCPQLLKHHLTELQILQMLARLMPTLLKTTKLGVAYAVTPRQTRSAHKKETACRHVEFSIDSLFVMQTLPVNHPKSNKRRTLLPSPFPNISPELKSDHL